MQPILQFDRFSITSGNEKKHWALTSIANKRQVKGCQVHKLLKNTQFTVCVPGMEVMKIHVYFIELRKEVSNDDDFSFDILCVIILCSGPCLLH